MANTVKRVLNVEDGVDEVVAPHCGGGVLGEDPGKLRVTTWCESDH